MLSFPEAAARANAYFGTAAPLRRLGFGIGGFVYLSPDARSAVKIHNGDEGYRRELEVYERLQRMRIVSLEGFTVPRLHGYRHDIRAIQMDVVRAPFLLDFAGTLFSPADFGDDRVERNIGEKFGSNAWLAHLVRASLAKRGLFYVDFRQSNLNMDGHLQAVVPTWDDDEPW